MCLGKMTVCNFLWMWMFYVEFLNRKQRTKKRIKDYGNLLLAVCGFRILGVEIVNADFLIHNLSIQRMQTKNIVAKMARDILARIHKLLKLYGIYKILIIYVVSSNCRAI